MQGQILCYCCDRPATAWCQNWRLNCLHSFCARHGDTLCMDCRLMLSDDDASARERARARFFHDLPASLRQRRFRRG